MSSPNTSNLQTLPKDFNFSGNEDRISELWKKNNCFDASLKLNRNNHFTSYDGGPFCTGDPHMGHALISVIKDTVARHQTMNGKYVRRRAAWDCHGLPIEALVTDKIGLKSKKDIEEYGINNFNDECRKSITLCSSNWGTFFDKIGRWVDYENDQKTCDFPYMESCLWAFKELWNKGLVYQGYKVMPYSTGLETELSNFESKLEYKTVTDLSVYISLKLNSKFMDVSASLLVWTTTPWTLPSNLAVCVNAKLTYVMVKSDDEYYILAKSCLKLLPSDYIIINEFIGTQLVGLSYEPLFDYFTRLYKVESTHFTVLEDNYVKDDSGTGIVHLAPGFGEDDHRVCLKNGLVDKIGKNIFVPIDSTGCFTNEVSDFTGRYVKDSQLEIEIAEKIKQQGSLLKKQRVKHEYPHCYRTRTPLLYKAGLSWFINVEAVKDKLIANNQEINWVPEHVKNGRFGEWLNNAQDWSFSRSRYWGTPVPLWVNTDDENDVICVGSVEELYQLSGVRVTDLHREFVDDIIIKQDDKTYKRVPFTFDCWFESGSYPYAHLHYPFENKDLFEQTFPADLVCEASDQTRGWFYTLNVLSTMLFDKPAFKNCICTGLVLAEDGQKMSKSLKNYTPPLDVIKTFCADAIRLYLMGSPLVRADTLSFSDKGVGNVMRDMFMQWTNAYKMFIEQYTMFNHTTSSVSSDVKFKYNEQPTSFLDRWIQQELKVLVKQVHCNLNKYDLSGVVMKLRDFIEQMCNWYIKLNRHSLRGGEDKHLSHWMTSLSVFHKVLLDFSLLMAPLTPFLSETMYQQLKLLAPKRLRKESVHHCQYKNFFGAEDQLRRTSDLDENISKNFAHLQRVIGMIRILRDKHTISLRKPVKKIIIAHNSQVLDSIKQLERYLLEETNVLEIEYTDKDKYFTQELKPVKKTIGQTFRRDAGKVFKIISQLSSDQINMFLQNGKLVVDNFEITKEHINVIPKLNPVDEYEHFLEESDDPFVVYMDVKMNKETLGMYLSNLFCIGVQQMRKDCGLQPWNKIKIYYTTNNLELYSMLGQNNSSITKRLKYPVQCLEATKSRPYNFQSVLVSKVMEIEGCVVEATIVCEDMTKELLAQRDQYLVNQFHEKLKQFSEYMTADTTTYCRCNDDLANILIKGNHEFLSSGTSNPYTDDLLVTRETVIIEGNEVQVDVVIS
jgi:isoleucyl-tRNA synthetase